MKYAEKNISIILVVLLTLLLLALVIWMFDKKLESIEQRIQKPATGTIDNKTFIS